MMLSLRNNNVWNADYCQVIKNMENNIYIDISDGWYLSNQNF